MIIIITYFRRTQMFSALAYPGRPYSRNKQVTPKTGSQGCCFFYLVRFQCFKIWNPKMSRFINSYLQHDIHHKDVDYIHEKHFPIKDQIKLTI